MQIVITTVTKSGDMAGDATTKADRAAILTKYTKPPSCVVPSVLKIMWKTQME